MKLLLRNIFYLHFLISLLSVQWVAAQQTNIAQLQDQLKNANNDEKIVINSLLSEAHMAVSDWKAAMQYAKEAEKIAKKQKSTAELGKIYSLLGDISFAKTEYKDALNYYEDAAKYYKLSANINALATTYYNIGTLNTILNKTLKIDNAFEESLKYARLSQNKGLILKITEELFNYYYERNKYKQSLAYFKEYAQIKDSTFTIEQKNQITVLRQQYVAEKEQLKETQEKLQVTNKDLAATKDILTKTDSTLSIVQTQRDTLSIITHIQSEEIEALNFEQAYKDQVIKSQGILRNVLIGGIVIILLFMGLLLHRYLYKKKTEAILRQQKEEIEAQRDNLEEMNKELEQQKEEIIVQRDEIFLKNDHLSTAYETIEQTNKHITSSIKYALEIQRAALPSEEVMNSLIPNRFIFYRPRDIVSGDFYWVRQVNNKTIIAIADCTGHGVPGAFVSMLGISLLNEITLRTNVFSAADILEALRQEVKSSLKQTGKFGEQKDGMDIALIVYDAKSKTLQFSGANNPLYYIRNNELNEIKSVKNPIGVYPRELPFSNTTIEIAPTDVFYLFTDGLVDQFGGEKGDKLKSQRFKAILTKISTKPIKEQEILLEKEFKTWIGDEEQIDDILIVGLKFT